MNEGRIKFEEYFTNLERVLHISASSYIFERVFANDQWAKTSLESKSTVSPLEQNSSTLFKYLYCWLWTGIFPLDKAS